MLHASCGMGLAACAAGAIFAYSGLVDHPFR